MRMTTIDDPNQIIPTEDDYALPFIQYEGEGFLHEYVLPASIKGFCGTYYHESGDVKPGCTCTIPWDYPLDWQGHVAAKRHSGTATYASTGICYPQQTDPAERIRSIHLFRCHQVNTTCGLPWHLGLFALSPSGVEHVLSPI